MVESTYFQSFQFSFLSVNGACALLYAAAVLIAWWQSCERRHLESTCATQLSPIFRHSLVQRPLVRFPRLLAVSFALRGGWFVMYQSDALPSTCTASTLADDCENVFVSAASRLSQLLFFGAFVLIVMFWTQWSVGYDSGGQGETHGAAGGSAAGGGVGGAASANRLADLASSSNPGLKSSHRGGSSGGTADAAAPKQGVFGCAYSCWSHCFCCPSNKRAFRCTAFFLVLCVWFFLLQCAAVALKLYNTLEVDDTISDDSMQDLYQLYTLMLGGTFAVLTLGMGMSGVWLRRRLNQQISDYNQWEARHSYNPVSMPHRLPNPEARFSTAAAALAPDPLSDLWREPHEDPQAVLSPVRTDAAHWHGRADSTDDDDHPRRSRKFQLPMKTTTLFRDKFKGKGDVGTPSKAASSHNAKPARQRTTSLLRSALRHLAFIQVVCVLLFAMIAFLNVISPSLSIEREHGEVELPSVYPWLFYPVPELVPGLLVLFATAPQPATCHACKSGARAFCCCTRKNRRSRKRLRYMRRPRQSTSCISCCCCGEDGGRRSSSSSASHWQAMSRSLMGAGGQQSRNAVHGVATATTSDLRELLGTHAKHRTSSYSESSADDHGLEPRGRVGTWRGSPEALSPSGRESSERFHHGRGGGGAWSDESGDEAVVTNDALQREQVDALRLACRFGRTGEPVAARAYPALPVTSNVMRAPSDNALPFSPARSESSVGSLHIERVDGRAFVMV